MTGQAVDAPVGAVQRSDAQGTPVVLGPDAAGGSAPAADEAAVGGTRRNGYPRSLLQRAEEPPASPRSCAKNLLLQLVVVPRTPALQAAEDAMSFALLAVVLGTTEMLAHYLQEYYGVDGDHASVRRTRPDDFVVRFTNMEDLERVLSSQLPAGARSLCDGATGVASSWGLLVCSAIGSLSP